MKERSSVFWFFARSTIFYILGIISLMLVSEAILFFSVGAYGTIIDRVIDERRIGIAFKCAIALSTLVLCLPGRITRSRTDYTLKRLRISENEVLLMHFVYNTLVYFIIFAVQIVFALVICACKINAMDPALVSEQTMLLTFYKSDFLHSLLPLLDIKLWIRNIILIMMLGLSSAFFPYVQRRKKFSSLALFSVIYVFFWFEQGLDSGIHLFFTALIFVIMILHIIYIAKGEENDA